MYDSVLPGYYLAPEDIIAEGDRVVVRATVHGVHRGPFMGTPPTGKTVAFPLIIIYWLAEGPASNSAGLTATDSGCGSGGLVMSGSGAA